MAIGNVKGQGTAQFVDARVLGTDTILPLATGTKVKFNSVVADQGFGGPFGAFEFWQFIPVDETREVLLLNGDNMTVVDGDPSIAESTELQRPKTSVRKFRIQSKSEDNTWLIVIDQNGSTRAKLRIVVGGKLNLKVGFYRLKYESRQPNASCATVKTSLIPTVNSVYQPQANIVINPSSSCEILESKYDFGSPIELEDLKKFLRKQKWPTSERIHIVLVGTLHEHQRPKIDLQGYYDETSKCVIVEDIFPLKSMGLVLAHEIGHHFFGATHAQSSDNLMAEAQGNAGPPINLEPAQIVNARIQLGGIH